MLGCLSISVTERCPLSCAHCAPQSGPSKSRVIDTELARTALVGANEYGCALVNFSGGGEPFAAKDVLIGLVKEAAALRMMTRVTTSAVWATAPSTALAELGELREAGLEQIFLSCSDEHQAAVPLEQVVHGAAAARRLGILPFLYLVRKTRSSLTVEAVHREFDRLSVQAPHLFTADEIPLGRAALAPRHGGTGAFGGEELRRGCPSVGRNPMVHSDGNVTACSSVFSAECAALSVGRLTGHDMGAMLSRLREHHVTRILAGPGPFVLAARLGWASNDTGARFVNRCHLCGEVLSDPRFNMVTAAIPRRRIDDARGGVGW